MADDPKPKLGLDLSMPYPLWEAVAKAVRPSFADSYLARAVVVDNELWPKTTIAYDRLRQEGAAMRAIAKLGYVLKRPARNGKWRPLTDQEYENLSVRDKIRHHEIMASHAKDKAGPLYQAHGRNLAELRKHEAWNELERREAGHHAEAKRLREYLHA